MRGFPGATQPQVEDLGRFFLRTDLNDNWQGVSPRYPQQDFNQEPSESRQDTTEYVTSPPLSSFSGMLKDGNEFEPGLGLGSLPKEPILLQQPLAPAGVQANVTDAIQSRDAMDLVNFSLGQQNPPPPMPIPDMATTQQVAYVGMAPTSSAQPDTPCPATLWSSDDDEFALTSGGSCQRTTSCEDDRSFRKKSREKMRRKEVNNEFDLLVDLLGFTNRVRKKVILHEAASTIKSLKRECNHLRRDRDLLKQQLAKLAAHLESPQLEPIGACVPTGDDVEQRSEMNFSTEPYRYEYMQAQPECRQYPRIC